VYPSNDHFAEKLHAYTKPRDTPSRVKDLLVMALMIEAGLVTASPSLAGAVKQTFERYATHPLPETFPEVKTWKERFETDAGAIGLSPTDIKVWVTSPPTFYQTLVDSR
jgi:hypothetical protein